ncbi:high-affinity choline transporter 1 [Biomphalaria glabrata]|uniref:High-affinity choline transporter 1-like n=1 Tax=Biomphalaria glabrata TaxID=6526 RepID=A0A9W2Z4D5_BIOGL|nr:high-affinity choline transporter 1-like [Biomphalaria glabrata]XP_055869782.1 high-affinity choline transporter 1-like [Biomphalaria glabrata]KAI8745148.1 high-affinity choline transporter 1-like [Biomphalaria glabrata]
MTVNVPCLVAVILMYLLVLVIGVVTAKKTHKSQNSEEVMIANRSLGFGVAFFTLTATMVCGGFINGTAEFAAWHGLLQTQAPIGYCIGFFLSGIFFAPKLRREKYITMFDPFQFKYGRKMGSLLIFPHLFGDVFWSATVLASLGATVSIIVDLDPTLSIIVSALVAVIYTFLGGLYAVAYTDVIQLILVAIGLVVACPFAMTDQHVNLDNITSTWVGEVKSGTEWLYLDTYCLLILGGTTVQPFYQRILACKSARVAVISTCMASLFSFLLSIPAFIIGVAGSAADWNSTDYTGPLPIPEERRSHILPMTLSYLVPLPVSIIGLGAISAASMSSADSCFLSTATVITKNIYKDIFRNNASDRELMWILRIFIVISGTAGTVIAIYATSIYGLFVLCSDLLYVILFPQMIGVLWIRLTNTYGMVSGFVVALIIRILSGDPTLNIPAVIKYPLYEEETGTQLFPFRTFCMACGFVVLIAASALTNFLFSNDYLSIKYDIFNCRRQRSHQNRNWSKDPPSLGAEDALLKLQDMKSNGSGK